MAKRYGALTKTLYILSFFLAFTACVRESEEPVSLYEGTFYLSKEKSKDTLFFQKTKPPTILRNWQIDKWSIKGDSIFQEDSRGFAYFLGFDKCKFRLKSDTLFVSYVKKIRPNYERTNLTVTRQYLILKSNKQHLELVELNKNKMVDTSNQIRRDIRIK